MPENYQRNVGRGSKISDLSSKIKEAENDLSVSRGIKVRSDNSVNLKQNNLFVSDKSSQGFKGVSELHVLRLKQIETAQRLKETLRRNVDLMTELQKARGVVRSLEKKLSLIERRENDDLFHDTVAKDTTPLCSHCPKQQEEINKLKMHIIEMNESFQKRWDDTQMELFQAKQSLSDVSRKLLDSINNGNKLKGTQVSQFQNLNSLEISESMENLRLGERTVESSKNNASYRQNGSEAQSPSTYKLSRPSSSNLSNDLYAQHHNLNSYSLINNETNRNQYNEFIHQSETPRSNYISTNTGHFFNNNQRSDLNSIIKHNRPQSEHRINYPMPETIRMSNNKPNNGFDQTIGDGANCDPITRIRSLDSITIHPGVGSYANSFPSGIGYKLSSRKYDFPSRDLTSNHFSNPFIYPNTYSSNILSLNKTQTPSSNPSISGTDMFNSNKARNSLFSGNDNTSYDKNPAIQNQLDIENSIGLVNLNSHPTSESNNIQGSTCLSPNSQTIIEPVKDQTVSSSSASFNDNLIEYPSSPATKDSLNGLEVDPNTYGNIRKTLEELKKTQDQRVQQLKDDREKLLRAVLNDLQEMKDFKTNFSSIKENQEKMIKIAPKSLFSLDSNQYENL